MLFRKRTIAPPPTISEDTVHAVARTHVGRVRVVNEDRFLVRSDRGLWAVADGMGGHDDGAAAASVAIAVLEDLAENTTDVRDEDIFAALERANAAIYRSNQESGRASGTTIVVGQRTGNALVVYWAGDSRAYWIRANQARLLTHDHSLVQEWIDAGMIDASAARDHPRSNIITRALGVDEAIAVDRVACEFAQGDRVVLCSDGLSRSQKITDFVAPKRCVGDYADRLLMAALQRDGSDNATLIVLEHTVI
jgi:serine/threonine-protein phosphatase Stp1